MYVSAALLGSRRCVGTELGGGARDAEISVRCTTPAGVPADAEFVAQFHIDEATHPGESAYATVLNPDASSTPALMLQANSTGGTNAAFRLGTGSYSVQLPGHSGSSGVPHVSALGAEGHTCRITAWVMPAVGVACTTPAGVPVDARFSVSYRAAGVFTSGSGGHVYANQPTVTTDCAPASSWYSEGDANSVRRTATGTYLVTFRGLPGTGAPAVTAVDASAAVSCRPYVWYAAGSDAALLVRCEDTAGSPVDARFTASYAANPA